MIYSLIIIELFLCVVHGNYQSNFKCMGLGFEFLPKSPIQILFNKQMASKLFCAGVCNNNPSCRIFNYDYSSKQCEIFEGDLTTGSISTIIGSNSTVCHVDIQPELYVKTYKKNCSECMLNRYTMCTRNATTCQCPANSYWNGDKCILQLFENDTCNNINACRQSLNLTCTNDCYGNFERCQSVTQINNTGNGSRAGITVAGSCNQQNLTDATMIRWPADVLLIDNGTLFVGDYDNKLLIFQNNSRNATLFGTFPDWPSFFFFDARTSSFYVSVHDFDVIYIFPWNITIPPIRNPTRACALDRLYMPASVILDSSRNVYVSSTTCNWVMRWQPNATSGTIVAGSTVGTAGSTSTLLRSPYGLALDEVNSYLYVSDRQNHRVQRFSLNSSGPGVTVAGGHGAGAAANQLNRPTEILLSKFEPAIYIADSSNNRVQKWMLNSSFGITVAGSSTGTSGSSRYLMDLAYAISLDLNETNLYVTDSNNNRIQRFTLK